MLRIFRVFVWVAAAVLLLGLATLTTVDRSPKEDSSFYKNTVAALASSTWSSSTSSHWLGGWATVNVTPTQPAELVGYSPRGPYTFVQDSSHVKALILSNGKSSIAWLNYELLIVHPQLAEQVRAGVQEAGISLDQLIFTATHTHSGMGGYMPGMVGSLAFGGYDEQVVEQLVVPCKRPSLPKTQSPSPTKKQVFRTLFRIALPKEALLTHSFVRYSYSERMDRKPLLSPTRHMPPP